MVRYYLRQCQTAMVCMLIRKLGSLTWSRPARRVPAICFGCTGPRWLLGHHGIQDRRSIGTSCCAAITDACWHASLGPRLTAAACRVPLIMTRVTLLTTVVSRLARLVVTALCIRCMLLWTPLRWSYALVAPIMRTMTIRLPHSIPTAVMPGTVVPAATAASMAMVVCAVAAVMPPVARAAAVTAML
jgi:hypothetical protein